MMRTKYLVIPGVVALSILISSCGSQNGSNEPLPPPPPPPKLSHVIYYLENSGGMHGYVSDRNNDFVNVLSDLAQSPRLVDNNPNFEEPSFQFNFINGFENMVITPIGNKPADFNSKLNVTDIDVGETRGSDFNAMFQLALSKAKNDSISIFITDAIYDIQNKPSLGAILADLRVEGRETRTHFIQRLNDDPDIQTLVIKLSSNFDGMYYFGASAGGSRINQERPYYIFTFGNSDLLNEYFDSMFITNELEGYEGHMRLYIPQETGIAYSPTPHDRIGDFIISRRDSKTLTNVGDRNGVFQFTIAANFSTIPVTEDYLMDSGNYTVSNGFQIVEISPVSGDMALGRASEINPTHLITLKMEGVPFGDVTVHLKNQQKPEWIEESHTDDDSQLPVSTDKTFGFKYLMDGIIEAYEHHTDSEYLITMSITLER